MKFEVYCDEANPDVLTSTNPRARHLMIGSLWLLEELRNEIKSRVGALRERHQAWGEIKWSKVSPNRRDFCVELVPGCMPPLAGRWPVTAAQKKQKPLIRYAGSAAETSIGSTPIGSELNARVYPKRLGFGSKPDLSSRLAPERRSRQLTPRELHRGSPHWPGSQSPTPAPTHAA